MKPPARWGRHWGIVADDLTGACDTGAPFAIHGFAMRVHLAARSIRDDVIGVSTDSRNDDPAEARRKVRLACEALARRGVTVIYKKIDSALRGNIGAELEAVLEQTGSAQAVITPAFPRLGRIYRGETFSGAERCHFVERPSDLAVCLGQKHPLLVVQATTDDDLRRIADVVLRVDPVPLLAGSGGLASIMAEVLSPRNRGGTDRGFAPAPGDSPAVKTGVPHAGSTRTIVLFIGTTHPVTRRQLEVLPSSPTPHVLVHVPPAETTPDVSAVWMTPNLAGLILSGGDTASAVCRALGVRSIRLAGEVLPGLPWGWLEGGRADGLPVCTKSGGFGSDDAFVRAGAFLARVAPQSKERSKSRCVPL